MCHTRYIVICVVVIVHKVINNFVAQCHLKNSSSKKIVRATEMNLTSI